MKSWATGTFFILTGLYILVIACFDWDRGVNTPRGRLYARIIGRQGVRIFNVVGGALLLIAGVLILLGYA